MATRKNKASIGYGQKSDFTKDLTCSPACSKYNLKTNFEESQNKGKGFSIGANREVAVEIDLENIV